MLYMRCFFYHITKIGEIDRLELKIFFAAQPWWAASC